MEERRGCIRDKKSEFLSVWVCFWWWNMCKRDIFTFYIPYLIMGKVEYLETFKDLRYNYIDNIPEHILNPHDENYHQYKCRWNYINGVRVNIRKLLQKNIITNESTITLGKSFIDYTEKRNYSLPTTHTEIAMINTLLDTIITDLESDL